VEGSREERQVRLEDVQEFDEVEVLLLSDECERKSIQEGDGVFEGFRVLLGQSNQ
jgi:hypothetical protein